MEFQICSSSLLQISIMLLFKFMQLLLCSFQTFAWPWQDLAFKALISRRQLRRLTRTRVKIDAILNLHVYICLQQTRNQFTVVGFLNRMYFILQLLNN